MAVALRQAAEYQQPPAQALLLAGGGLEDGLDGLLLGVPDKAAGIHQQHVHGAVLPFRYQLIGAAYLVKQMLRIDGVLGASQGDDLQGGHYSAFSASASRSSSVRKSSEAYWARMLYHSTTFFMWET